MSAYIVSRHHILYLTIAVTCRSRLKDCSNFSYWHRAASCRKTIGAGDYQAAADLANLLWRENIASVSARYPGESSATLPGPRNEHLVIYPADIRPSLFPVIDPVQVLKACDCFEYQSCEHDGWLDSEAKSIIDEIRSRAWHALPGYDCADWGAPEPRRSTLTQIIR